MEMNMSTENILLMFIYCIEFGKTGFELLPINMDLLFIVKLFLQIFKFS